MGFRDLLEATASIVRSVIVIMKLLRLCVCCSWKLDPCQCRSKLLSVVRALLTDTMYPEGTTKWASEVRKAAAPTMTGIHKDLLKAASAEPIPRRRKMVTLTFVRKPAAQRAQSV